MTAPDLPDADRIAAEEAFAKVRRDGGTLAASLHAALEAAAPALIAKGAADERAKWSAAIARHTITFTRPAMGKFSEGVDVVAVRELRDLLGGR